MSFAAVHRPHAIAFPPDNTPSYLTQLTDARMNATLEEYTERSAADAAPLQSGAIQGAPMLEFDTPDLKTVLDQCTDSGVCRAHTAGTTSLYYRKGVNRGIRGAVGSAIHDRFDALNSAFVYWNRISAQAKQIATINAAIKFISTDGLTAPLLAVGSTALAGSLAVSGLWTLGPVSLNASQVNSVKSVDLDNRFTFEDEDESGDKFQSYAEIDQWQPRLEILTNDITVWNTYGEDGTALTALTLYFRKMMPNRTGPKTNATAEHIKFTASAGSIFVSEATGMKAQSRVTVLLDKPNATTDPFTINTAIAIT